MVSLSPAFHPPVLKGIKVYKDNPFRFDFILDKGDTTQTSHNATTYDLPPTTLSGDLKDISSRLIKYFLASLTIPEKDLWVNLSPYEKDRIVPEAFGQTEMGRDLLAQDYLLKQITASALYPEGETGKAFWKKVYAEAQKRYGTTDIPVDTFNKVWIVPEKATVYENKDAAFVVESKLKVMLESDYLAARQSSHNPTTYDLPPTTYPSADIAKDVLKAVIIPILEKEVNEGQNFTQLRQVYHSLILATWYKRKVKESLIGQVYVDHKKTAGIDIADKVEAEKIWQRYVEAFKKGAYNRIREEIDPATQEAIPRKYFSGGADFAMETSFKTTTDLAMLPALEGGRGMVVQMRADMAMGLSADMSKAEIDGIMARLSEPKDLGFDRSGFIDAAQGSALDQAVGLGKRQEPTFEELEEGILAYARRDLHSRDLEQYLDDFDKEHYEYIEDEGKGYWVSKDFQVGGKRLALGTWEDIIEGPVMTMKYDIVIRCKGKDGVKTSSFYFYDDHGRALMYAMEAAARGEVPVSGNSQVFVDRHPDGKDLVWSRDGTVTFRKSGRKYPLIGDASRLRDWTGQDFFNEVTYAHFNEDFYESGFMSRFFGITGERGEPESFLSQEEYFALPGRPQEEAAVINIDTDATGVQIDAAKKGRSQLQREDFEFFAQLLIRLSREDNISPATFHASTSRDYEGYLKPRGYRIFGAVRIVQFLARLAPVIFLTARKGVTTERLRELVNRIIEQTFNNAIAGREAEGMDRAMLSSDAAMAALPERAADQQAYARFFPDAGKAVLQEEYFGYYSAIRRTINPQNNPMTVLSGGAGVSLADVLAATGGNEIYLADRYNFLGMTLTADYLRAFLEEHWQEYDKAFERRRSLMFHRGYDVLFDGTVLPEYLYQGLVVQLKALGLGLEDIDVGEEQGHVFLRFKRNLFGDKDTTVTVHFIHVDDLTDTSGYPEILGRLSYDCYYQNAGFSLPLYYSEFMPVLSRGLRAGGWWVTDDYISDKHNPGPFLLDDIVPGAERVELPGPVRDWEAVFLSRNSRRSGYGLIKSILRKVPVAIRVDPFIVELQAQQEKVLRERRGASSEVIDPVHDSRDPEAWSNDMSMASDRSQQSRRIFYDSQEIEDMIAEPRILARRWLERHGWPYNPGLERLLTFGAMWSLQTASTNFISSPLIQTLLLNDKLIRHAQPWYGAMPAKIRGVGQARRFGDSYWSLIRGSRYKIRQGIKMFRRATGINVDPRQVRILNQFFWTPHRSSSLGVVFLSQYQGITLQHILHEVFHQQFPGLLRSRWFDEGMTEFLTEKVLAIEGRAMTEEGQTPIVYEKYKLSLLARAIGYEPLIVSYMTGDREYLRNAFGVNGEMVLQMLEAVDFLGRSPDSYDYIRVIMGNRDSKDRLEEIAADLLKRMNQGASYESPVRKGWIAQLPEDDGVLPKFNLSARTRDDLIRLIDQHSSNKILVEAAENMLKGESAIAIPNYERALALAGEMAKRNVNKKQAAEEVTVRTRKALDPLRELVAGAGEPDQTRRLIRHLDETVRMVRDGMAEQYPLLTLWLRSRIDDFRKTRIMAVNGLEQDTAIYRDAASGERVILVNAQRAAEWNEAQAGFVVARELGGVAFEKEMNVFHDLQFDEEEQAELGRLLTNKTGAFALAVADAKQEHFSLNDYFGMFRVRPARPRILVRAWNHLRGKDDFTAIIRSSAHLDLEALVLYPFPNNLRMMSKIGVWERTVDRDQAMLQVSKVDAQIRTMYGSGFSPASVLVRPSEEVKQGIAPLLAELRSALSVDELDVPSVDRLHWNAAGVLAPGKQAHEPGAFPDQRLDGTYLQAFAQRVRKSLANVQGFSGAVSGRIFLTENGVVLWKIESPEFISWMNDVLRPAFHEELARPPNVTMSLGRIRKEGLAAEDLRRIEEVINGIIAKYMKSGVFTQAGLLQVSRVFAGQYDRTAWSEIVYEEAIVLNNSRDGALKEVSQMNAADKAMRSAQDDRAMSSDARGAMMARRSLGVPSQEVVTALQGEYTVASLSDGIRYLQTYGIGPCVGLIIWDPENHRAMLAHLDDARDIERSFQKIRIQLARHGWRRKGLRVYLMQGRDAPRFSGEVRKFLERVFNFTSGQIVNITREDEVETLGIDLTNGELYKVDRWTELADGIAKNVRQKIVERAMPAAEDFFTGSRRPLYFLRPASDFERGIFTGNLQAAEFATANDPEESLDDNIGDIDLGRLVGLIDYFTNDDDRTSITVNPLMSELWDVDAVQGNRRRVCDFTIRRPLQTRKELYDFLDFVRLNIDLAGMRISAEEFRVRILVRLNSGLWKSSWDEAMTADSASSSLTPDERGRILDETLTDLAPKRQGHTGVYSYIIPHPRERYLSGYISRIMPHFNVPLGGKRVLVVPGYSTLPFVVRNAGAAEVMSVDSDANLTAWLKAIDLYYHSPAHGRTIGEWFLSLGGESLFQADEGLPFLRAVQDLVRQDASPAALTGIRFELKDALAVDTVTDENGFDVVLIPNLLGLENGVTSPTDMEQLLRKAIRSLRDGGQLLVCPHHPARRNQKALETEEGNPGAPELDRIIRRLIKEGVLQLNNPPGMLYGAILNPEDTARVSVFKVNKSARMTAVPDDVQRAAAAFLNSHGPDEVMDRLIAKGIDQSLVFRFIGDLDGQNFESWGEVDANVVLPSQVMAAIALALADSSMRVDDPQHNVQSGGIDLTPERMSLFTSGAGEGPRFNIDPEKLKQLENAPGRAERARHVAVNSLRSLLDCSGLTPVILGIQPLESLPQFLGVPSGGGA
jgi:hypothetical protein